MSGNVTLKTKAMVEGAIAAALATVLGLIGYYLPPLAMVMTLLWYIPVTVIVVRQNLYWGVMTLAVTTFLLVILTQPIKGLLMVLQMGFVGLLFGYGFKQNWSVGKLIILGGLVVVLSTLLVLGLSALVLEVPLGEWQQEMAAQIDQTLEFYRQWGLINSQSISEEELRASLEQMMNFIALVIPGILISGSLLTAIISFLIARVILKRMSTPVQPIPPFREWQLPWYFIWGVTGALLLLLLGDYLADPLLTRVGLNILYIYFPLLLISGISVLTFYYHRLPVSKWLKIAVLTVLVIYLPFGIMLVTVVGLFDPVFNYRRLNKNTT